MSPWETAQRKGLQFAGIEEQEIEETGKVLKIGKVVPKLLKYLHPALHVADLIETLNPASLCSVINSEPKGIVTEKKYHRLSFDQ